MHIDLPALLLTVCMHMTETGLSQMNTLQLTGTEKLVPGHDECLSFCKEYVKI